MKTRIIALLLALGALLFLVPAATEAQSVSLTTAELPHNRAGSDDTRRVTLLPIDLSTSTLVEVLSVNVGPVDPGDVVRVMADAGVTNDTGRDNDDRAVIGTRYTVGVGYNLAYGTETGSGTKFGQSNGENVTVDTHHLVLNIARMLEVPSTWTPGEEMEVRLMVDAHSTAWNANAGKDVYRASNGNEALKVEPYGAILYDVWSQG